MRYLLALAGLALVGAGILFALRFENSTKEQEITIPPTEQAVNQPRMCTAGELKINQPEVGPIPLEDPSGNPTKLDLEYFDVEVRPESEGICIVFTPGEAIISSGLKCTSQIRGGGADYGIARIICEAENGSGPLNNSPTCIQLALMRLSPRPGPSGPFDNGFGYALELPPAEDGGKRGLETLSCTD